MSRRSPSCLSCSGYMGEYSFHPSPFLLFRRNFRHYPTVLAVGRHVWHMLTVNRLFFHSGGNRGSGSSWLFDGGAFVKRSMQNGKPVILVTFKYVLPIIIIYFSLSAWISDLIMLLLCIGSYRLGLLGFASSPLLRDDNRAAGEEGVGNYGTCSTYLVVISMSSGKPRTYRLYPSSSVIKVFEIKGKHSNGYLTSYLISAETQTTLLCLENRPARRISCVICIRRAMNAHRCFRGRLCKVP